ncbi:tRNA (adenosine(37)-N6)-threonylcarbamoyltransferase complex dimerization subunit type 1 TsaB [Candidatus Curtissbacteria bacterium RBG_16_39_7]|uniref:tRNA (Adenosine(37)-N6)-threonylcarbamoyltransferase complex dimerization subunit type 1 TsaB n=1 Tax=Candidatus Curtissbacteria bacterium RBG_16_39_7 TaxID=1797707 RepID=A0A1F5G4H6_9BACT|nr:MAG: tRNA (adenosine(37)-N6)-threonylcarbamoyltransferase complex dimerization subunit type 1 TsaB [Candidatus Curtissbacteria bacterium RBG_16_39_7]
MILAIDTSETLKTSVYLKDGNDRVKDRSIKERKPGSQVLLPMIIKILKKNKLDPKDLTGIEVNCGPGSYTGLRVGISVASALGYFLKIPVNSKKVEKMVFPKYE